MPTDQRTPRTAISLREPGKYFRTRTRCKQRHHSLFANSNFPIALNSSLSGTITPSVFWSTNMACRWLNVPRPTSWTEYEHQYPRASTSQMQVPGYTTEINGQPPQRYERYPTSAVEKSIPLPDSMLCNRFLTCLCNLGWSSYDRLKFNTILGYQRNKTYEASRNSYTSSSYSIKDGSIHACLQVMFCFFACRPYHARPISLKRQRWKYVWSHFRQFRFKMSFVSTNRRNIACSEYVFRLEQAIIMINFRNGGIKEITNNKLFLI